ncbi:MAG: hypothetical protein R2712_27035 [Vicinamibacterales bacterium]
MEHDSSPESPGPAADTPPRWIDSLLDRLKEFGLSPHLLERFVHWWRHFGLLKSTALMLAVLGPLLRFEILPAATSSLAESVAEAQGLRLHVEDWRLSLTDFSATAYGVVIETGGRYREPFLFRADAVEIDASLWQNVGAGVARLPRRVGNAFRWVAGRPRVPLPPAPIGRSVTVSGGELYLERLMSGRGNWDDAVARTVAPGLESDDESDPYYLPELELNDFKITYLEHLPAEPGSGLEQSLTSTLHLDEGTLTIGDFIGPDDTRDDPTDFALDGRVGDGRVSINGAFNLWAASFGVDISLNNVGAATLGVLSSEASVVPAAGTMTGHIALAVRDDQLRECDVNVTFADVRYRVNPRSPFIKSRQALVARDLETVNVSGPIESVCSGNWSDPEFRPMWAVQSTMTARALAGAPASVQSAALFDPRRFSQGLTGETMQAELQRVADEMTRQIGQQVGEQTGNAMSRGLKSVGRGIGRLFGRKPK